MTDDISYEEALENLLLSTIQELLSLQEKQKQIYLLTSGGQHENN